MSKKKEKIVSYDSFALPNTIVTHVDVSRLVREMERVDNELTTAAVRKKAGSHGAASPLLSDELADFLDDNNIGLENSHDRTTLIKHLRELKDKAPVVHMTFAAPADPESLQELVLWFRKSVNKQTLLEVGLQPALVGGVYIRTPNHVHDFSLRSKLQGQRELLMTELGALRG